MILKVGCSLFIRWLKILLEFVVYSYFWKPYCLIITTTTTTTTNIIIILLFLVVILIIVNRKKSNHTHMFVQRIITHYEIIGSTHVNNSYVSMAYKMAYEVVVCKKQNGPCNEKTTRFLDCNFKSDHFLRLLGTFAAPPPPTSFTACAIHCHATNFVLCESPLERLPTWSCKIIYEAMVWLIIITYFYICFVNYLYCFYFLCTSGLSQEEFRCVHNDNKVLELERLQKASPHEPLPPPAGPQFQTQ